MTADLRLLAIADDPEDLQPLRGLLTTLEHGRQMHVSLGRVGWNRAWQALLMDAVEGKGPHVSQIGSTWVATMAMLDALRIFTPKDVLGVGGPDEFLPAAWDSVRFADRPGVWAIPWSIYTFVLYYRNDLLKQCGIDPVNAFVTPGAMCETFERLSQAGVAAWAFPSLRPYADLVHIASSWARAYGGDYMSTNGREPRFASAATSAGLVEFFELFRFMPNAMHGSTVEDCTRLFARGEVATLIGGVEVGNELMDGAHTTQAVRDNLAVTTLPGVSWIGGDHLVVWKNVLKDIQQERQALELVQYLTQREAQLELFKQQGTLPARADVYDELTFPLESTRPTLEKILLTGRPHPSLRLWRRIEAFLDEMLMEIGSMVLRQPAVPVSEITLNMLKQHEQNLSAVLKG